jgi:hypothetical protein
MKTKSLFALAAFSFVSWNLSHVNIPSIHSITGRLPASEESSVAKKEEDKSKANVACEYESKGEKLKKDVEKNLEDNQKVINKVEDKILDKMKDEKVADKGTEKNADKSEAKKPIDNSDLIALLSQMTNMMSMQMQMQMLQQNMLISLLSQQFNLNFNNNSFADMNGQFSSPKLTLEDNLNILGKNVGIGSNQNYQNPYSMLPSIERVQIPMQSNFSFNQMFAPVGFDFSYGPQANVQAPLNTHQELTRNFIQN